MNTYEKHDSLTFCAYTLEEMADELRYTVTVHVTDDDGGEYVDNPFFLTTDDYDEADFVAHTLSLHYAMTLRRCMQAMGLTHDEAMRCMFTLWLTDNETDEVLLEEEL